ncbi:MAG: hypothetical protein AMXMBFR83_14140 [Phycisphaerae bacterium]
MPDKIRMARSGPQDAAHLQRAYSVVQSRDNSRAAAAASAVGCMSVLVEWRGPWKAQSSTGTGAGRCGIHLPPVLSRTLRFRTARPA